jgi:hypothetical protein
MCGFDVPCRQNSTQEKFWDHPMQLDASMSIASAGDTEKMSTSATDTPHPPSKALVELVNIAHS